MGNDIQYTYNISITCILTQYVNKKDRVYVFYIMWFISYILYYRRNNNGNLLNKSQEVIAKLLEICV